MNKPDDLGELWQTQPVRVGVKGEDMREAILMRTAVFDRTIRWRNAGEYIAALVLLPALYFVWMLPNTLVHLGCILIAAGTVWIVYYLRRHGSGPADPLPDQSLTSYRRALIAKYDRQIRLARTVKFWYLLPLYAGLMTTVAGLLQMASSHRKSMLFIGVYAVAANAFFVFVWWLNEVRAVRRLEHLRSELLSASDTEQDPQVV